MGENSVGEPEQCSPPVWPSFLFPEVQWWQSWSYIQTLCKIT